MPFQLKPKHAVYAAIAFAALIAALASIYTVPEGHVAVVKRFSKAIAQVDPGLHVKIPFVDSIEAIEVRQRKNTEELAAATENQLPVSAQVSINWTVDKSSAMALFVQYGGLDQFETRILDPKLRSVAKAAISQFPADQLIRNRQAAVTAIMDGMTAALAEFPVTVNSPQIENLALPPTYLEAVQQKERAREDAEREKHTLEQQRLVAPSGGELRRSERHGETPRGRRRSVPRAHRSDRRSRRHPARHRAVGQEPGVRRARAREALGRGAAANRARRRRRGAALDAGRALRRRAPQVRKSRVGAVAEARRERPTHPRVVPRGRDTGVK